MAGEGFFGGTSAELMSARWKALVHAATDSGFVDAYARLASYAAATVERPWRDALMLVRKGAKALVFVDIVADFKGPLQRVGRSVLKRNVVTDVTVFGQPFIIRVTPHRTDLVWPITNPSFVDPCQLLAWRYEYRAALYVENLVDYVVATAPMLGMTVHIGPGAGFRVTEVDGSQT